MTLHDIVETIIKNNDESIEVIDKNFKEIYTSTAKNFKNIKIKFIELDDKIIIVNERNNYLSDTIKIVNERNIELKNELIELKNEIKELNNKINIYFEQNNLLNNNKILSDIIDNN